MSRPSDPAPASGPDAASTPPSAAARTTADRAAAARLAAARGAARAAADQDADAGPRHETLWAAVVFAVATLLLAYPALAGRFLVTPQSDQYLAGYAFREFGASMLKSGAGFPLWNPYLFGGMPFVAAMHGDIFYPTFLLRMLLPADAGMTWGLVLHVFLAGLFAFRFFRALGIRFHAALVGGLAYMLGGNVAGLVSPGHDGKLFIAALLPLGLLMVYRGVGQGRRWAWGALAIVITLAVLTPHPQLLQYLLLVTGAFAVFVAFAPDERGERRPRKEALTRLALAGVSVAVGMLGGAIQFAPVFQYTPFSPRSGGKGWEHAISYSMPPEELLDTYLPQFSGILEHYWGRNGIHFHSEYIGAAVLVLAGLAFGMAAPLRRYMWFWLGTLIVSVLWALGGYTPFFHLVYAIVPGTKYFRAPSTMLYVVAFSVSTLAAFGTHRLLSAGRGGLKYAIGWVAAAAILAVMATTGMLSNLGLGFAHPALVAKVAENAGALTIGAWRSFLAVAVAAAIIVGTRRGAIRAQAAGWALAALVTVDLWSVLRLYWRFSPPASVIYAADPIVDYLKARRDSARVVTLPIEEAGQVVYHDPFLYGDALMSHRIRQVSGYHGNELGRYQHLMTYGTEGWPMQIANANFLRLTNLQFMLTNLPQAPMPGATRILGPVKNAAGSTQYLYRLPGDNPPAWVAPLAVKAPDENVLATVLDPRFDVRRVALFDTASTVTAQAVPQQLPEALDLSARITSFGPGRISLTLSAPAPAGAALLVSENYYPGWTATADGKPAAIGRADYTLIGVVLPTGARQVELTFDSPRYHLGRTITLAALALALVAMGAGFVTERGRRG